MPEGPYDVIAIIGDSNGNSGHEKDDEIDVTHPRMLEYRNNGSIILASDSLEGSPWANPQRIGPLTTFARDYYIPQRLRVGRSVLLVHTNVGGTGVTDGSGATWNVGGSDLNAAIAKCDAAMKSYRDNRFAAVICSISTNDGICLPQYTDRMIAMTEEFRANVQGASNVPFVFMGMTPAFVGDSGAYFDCEHIVAELPLDIENSCYGDPHLLSDPGVNLHFTAAQHREYAGILFDAYDALVAPDTSGVWKIG